MALFVNSVSHGIYTLLSSDSAIVSSNTCVELDEIFNSDPEKTPWVGIYLDPTPIVPKRVGLGACNLWVVRYTYRIFVQDFSHDSGQEANDRVNRLSNMVFDALNGDHTLLNSVNTITEMSISPFQRDIENEQWYFSNEFFLIAEQDA